MKKMRFFLFSGLIVFGTFQLSQCKSMAKTAAKYWAKKQIRAFKQKCNDGAATNKLIGNAADFCDCATNSIMEKYPNYDDAKNMNILQLVKEASNCLH